LAVLIASLTIAFSQVNALKEAEKITGKVIPIPNELPSFDKIDEDRPLRDELSIAAAKLLDIG
jgi:hypothetical protein